MVENGDVFIPKPQARYGSKPRRIRTLQRQVIALRL
jgi:hypothetical protein